MDDLALVMLASPEPSSWWCCRSVCAAADDEEAPPPPPPPEAEAVERDPLGREDNDSLASAMSGRKEVPR